MKIFENDNMDNFALGVKKKRKDYVENFWCVVPDKLDGLGLVKSRKRGVLESQCFSSFRKYD